MKNGLLIIANLIFVLLITAPVFAEEQNKETDMILSSSESLFQAMQKKNYSQIWEFLSHRSKDTIISDTYKSIKSNRDIYTKENIEKDFNIGDLLAKSYWNAFLKNFDPKMILEQSKWNIESIKKDYAEISIIYTKAKSPAILRMFKESGQWKVGLVESFWTRKDK